MTDTGEFCVSETLKNGVEVTIRALRASDRDKIASAVRLLDRESIYTRLFSYRKELTEAGLDRILTVDPARDGMLVVTVGAGAQETIIASGRFIAARDESAARGGEIAFMVEEDYHGQGIAGRLLRHLIEIARNKGIVAFEAEVLSENNPMLAVFAKSGLPMRRRRDGGVVHVTLSLSEAPA